MSRWNVVVRSLLTTGLLAACLAGCSKSEESRRDGNPQARQTNAVAVVLLFGAEDTAKALVLKTEAEKFWNLRPKAHKEAKNPAAQKSHSPPALVQ